MVGGLLAKPPLDKTARVAEDIHMTNPNPERDARAKELARWSKPRLIGRAAALGHHGLGPGRNGLGRWSRDELRAAILRSEFPTVGGR